MKRRSTHHKAAAYAHGADQRQSLIVVRSLAQRSDRHPGLRVLAGVFGMTGVIFGTLEVVMVAFATGRAARALAGPLLAL